jgi:stalled ribosome rescue protein Dom34
MPLGKWKQKCKIHRDILATKKIKQIMTTTTHNTTHKRYQHNIKQKRNILQQNDQTIKRADKSKSIVIINKNALKQKVEDFIHA